MIRLAVGAALLLAALYAAAWAAFGRRDFRPTLDWRDLEPVEVV